jgi:hypothetical protein
MATEEGTELELAAPCVGDSVLEVPMEDDCVGRGLLLVLSAIPPVLAEVLEVLVLVDEALDALELMAPAHAGTMRKSELRSGCLTHVSALTSAA